MKRSMPKRTLEAILRRLAEGMSAKDISKRVRSINTQQIGAIITNVRHNVYDEDYPKWVAKILANRG